jgi:hypothetical protein
MPADRDRDSPYGRSRDDRRRDRSRSRERDRDWSYDRGRGWSPRRRSVSCERTRSGEGRRRRSHSRSPMLRDERERERRPLSRNEEWARGSSRPDSPARKRRSSPTPPPDGPRYRRDYSSSYRNPSYQDSPHYGYGQDDSPRSRDWNRGSSYTYPRGGFQQRQYDSHHARVTDTSNTPVQRTPPTATSSSLQSSQSPESMRSQPITSNNDQSSSEPIIPSGPASWRRAQQYKQERLQQDLRPSFPPTRNAPPLNPLHRKSPRTPFSSTSHSHAVSPKDPTSSSPAFHRSSIPAGPRQPEAPVKKEYISPIPDLDEQVFLSFLLD